MNITSNAKSRGTERFLRSRPRRNLNGGHKVSSKPPSLHTQSKPQTKHRGTRSKLKFLLEALKKLDIVFEKVECYGQGIPCVRSVRELARRLKVQLGNEYGAFNRVLEELERTRIRGVTRVVERVEELRSIINQMIHNDRNYIQNLEDIRQCLGEMNGMVEVILNVECAKN